MDSGTFLRDAINRMRGIRYKTLSELAKMANVNQGNLSSFMKPEGDPKRRETMTFDSAWKILGVLGLQPDAMAKGVYTAPTKAVCFVDATVVPAGKNVAPPQAEDYLAAPMVGEVGAGRGYIAQDDVLSWFLVYRHALPAQHSGDLFAVQIGKTSTSMQPTLNPGDIVLVDRGADVRGCFGRMMLVRDADLESGMIKRVDLTPTKDNDTIITYYSDNAAQFRPMVYSLRDDFNGDLNNAIVGRVIWAWSDVRNK